MPYVKTESGDEQVTVVFHSDIDEVTTVLMPNGEERDYAPEGIYKTLPEIQADTAITIQTVYVKPTSRGQRVWLEDTPNNPRLSTAGFNMGARYTRTIDNGVITLSLDTDGKLKVSGKKLPIIDIGGKNIAGYSDNAELIVSYTPSTITIREV